MGVEYVTPETVFVESVEQEKACTSELNWKNCLVKNWETHVRVEELPPAAIK